MLTGAYPKLDEFRLPIAADHPRNLFSLLSGSYRMNAWETFTGLRSLRDDEETGGPGLADRMRAATSQQVAEIYETRLSPERLAWFELLPVVVAE